MADQIVIEINTELNEPQVKTTFRKIENIASGAGNKAASNFSNSFGSTITGSFRSVFGGLFNQLGGQIAVLGATLGAAFAGRGIVRAGATIERLETQFGILLKSSSDAQKQIQELTNFAARTPFQLEGLASASAQLLSFGFESETIIDRLATIGDVAAGSNSDLKEVALIFGQIRAAGKLTGERLLQLQERAIPIGSALAKSLGVAESQVRSLVSEGKVGFSEFEAAFNSLTQAGGLFEDATQKQAQTIGGLLSTLSDNFFALQVSIGKAFGPLFKATITESISILQGLTKSFNTNSQQIVKDVISTANSFNTFFVPVLVGIQRVGEIAFRSIVVGLNTIIAGFGQLASGAGRLISLLGGDGDLSRSLMDFGESSAEVLEQSINPLKDSLNSILEPSAFQTKADEFLLTLEGFAAQAGTISDGIVSKNKEIQKSITQTTSKTGKNLANLVNQALVQTTSKGIQELTKSLVTGADGFANFGKQVFSILGDLSIKLGETLLLTGTGIESLKSLSGAAAIAAGAGLIALGSLLKSLGEGPGLSGAPAGAGAGGFGGGVVGEDPSITDQVEEREEPETRNTVVVNGDVFDSEETGLRIVEILNDQSLNRGSVITNGAFA